MYMVSSHLNFGRTLASKSYLLTFSNGKTYESDGGVIGGDIASRYGYQSAIDHYGYTHNDRNSDPHPRPGSYHGSYGLALGVTVIGIAIVGIRILILLKSTLNK